MKKRIKLKQTKKHFQKIASLLFLLFCYHSISVAQNYQYDPYIYFLSPTGEEITNETKVIEPYSRKTFYLYADILTSLNIRILKCDWSCAGEVLSIDKESGFATILGPGNATVSVSVTYQVFKSNGEFYSNYTTSSLCYIEVPQAPEPQKPTITSTSNYYSISLSWKKDVHVLGYKVYRVTGTNTKTLISTTENTSFSFSGLTPGTLYKYAVTAYNDIAESEPCYINKRTVALPPIPAAPTNLTDTETACGKYTLSWSHPTPSSVTKYYIYRDNIQIGTTTSRLYYLEAPLGGIINNYTIKAKNDAGYSNPSNLCTIKKYGTVAPPSNVSTVDTPEGFITTWSHSENVHDKYILTGRMGIFDQITLNKNSTQANLNSLFSLNPNTFYLFTLHPAYGKCLLNAVPIQIRTGSTVKSKNINNSKEVDILESSVAIYPNPTKNSLNFKGISDFNYKIYDLKGACVLEGENCNESIDVRKLSKGIYQIKINKENTIISKKFIKE